MLSPLRNWSNGLFIAFLALIAAACSNGDDAVVHVRKPCTPVYVALYDGQGNDLLADTAAISVYSNNLDEPQPVVIVELDGRHYLRIVPVMNGRYQQQVRLDGSGQREAYIQTTIRVGERQLPLFTYLHHLPNGRVDSLRESSIASRGYQLHARRITVPEKAWVADIMLTPDGSFLCQPSLVPERLTVNIDFYSPQGTDIIDSLSQLPPSAFTPQPSTLTIVPHNAMPAQEQNVGWTVSDTRLSLSASMGDWTYHKLRGTKLQQSSYTFQLSNSQLFGDEEMHTVELTFDRSSLGNRITGCALDGKAFDVAVVAFRESMSYGVNLQFYQK